MIAAKAMAWAMYVTKKRYMHKAGYNNKVDNMISVM